MSVKMQRSYVFLGYYESNAQVAFYEAKGERIADAFTAIAGEDGFCPHDYQVVEVLEDGVLTYCTESVCSFADLAECNAIALTEADDTTNPTEAAWFQQFK